MFFLKLEDVITVVQSAHKTILWADGWCWTFCELSRCWWIVVRNQESICSCWSHEFPSYLCFGLIRLILTHNCLLEEILSSPSLLTIFIPLMHHLNGKMNNFLLVLFWVIFLPFLLGLYLSQECKEMAPRSRQKLHGFEEICEKLAHENNSVRNRLSQAHKECSSLLAACALLSGALCPLYGRLCAVSSQRDILQHQANLHELVTQKIRNLLYALPTTMESNQEEERLRQRRGKQLIYVFRRAVIAVLATNRLRALARYSSSLFVWTGGSRGSTRIPVCVGESRGRCYMSSKWNGFEVFCQITWLGNNKEQCYYYCWGIKTSLITFCQILFMDFCFLFLDKCISLEEELSSLLSIAGKIAVIHMNSTQSAIIDICVMDFTTRCYSIFSVVNNLQCFKMINHQLIVCVFLKGISSYFKIILNIYFLLKPSKNCFLIQVKH